MIKAPERIWVYVEGPMVGLFVSGESNSGWPEYVRADLYADLVAEVAAFRARGDTLPARIETEAQQIEAGRFIAEGRALWKRLDGIRDAEGRPMLEGKRGIDGFFKDLGSSLDDVTSVPQRAADDYVRRKAAEARAKAEREAQEARERAEAERRRAEAAKTPEVAGRAEARAEQADAQADRAAETASASTADLTRSRMGGVTASAKEVWDIAIEDYGAAIDPLGSLGPYLKAKDMEDALRSTVRIQKANAKWPGVRFFTRTTATFRA